MESVGGDGASEVGFADAEEGGRVEACAVRWRPACTSRMEPAGADVRRERRCWRWWRGVEVGIVRGIAGCLC